MARSWQKWIRSKADELAVEEGCTFDLAAADRVRFFFQRFLRHSKGEWAGKPFELLDWEWLNLIAPLYGWKRKNGTRRYRRAGWWVAKKNGKSALCSAISVFMITGDGEPGAEVYNAAADREQAGIVYGEAANMVESSPALSKLLRLRRSTKRIVWPATQSWYKALSADVPTKEGLNWHCLIVDELHAQRNRELWDTLVYGGAARRQPLLISISTAGYDRDTIGYEQYCYANQVADGTIEDSGFLPFIAEASTEDDWRDRQVWRKANPSYGITIKEEAFEADFKEAVNSPAKENAFRRYRLNQWTEQGVRWLQMPRWDACAAQVDAGKLLDQLLGRECYAGLDLSSTTDLAALVLLFPYAATFDDDHGYYLLPFFWVPAEACKLRERTNKTRLDGWVRKGLIEATPGDVLDYARIRTKLNELGQLYRIVEVGIDRWNATQLSVELAGDGFKMTPFGQGFASMSAPTKEFEKLVLGKQIRHAGHAVLRWNARNVAVEQDAAGNLKPSKAKSTEKIDGIVAAIIALGCALLRPPQALPSIEWL